MPPNQHQESTSSYLLPCEAFDLHKYLKVYWHRLGNIWILSCLFFFQLFQTSRSFVFLSSLDCFVSDAAATLQPGAPERHATSNPTASPKREYIQIPFLRNHFQMNHQHGIVLLMRLQSVGDCACLCKYSATNPSRLNDFMAQICADIR